MLIRYDSTRYVQIESKSKRFWGSSSDTLALHFTPDPQLKVAGVHLAAAPPCLAGGRTSDTGNKMLWEGHERRRRGHPLTVAANGTSHPSSPTSNLAPSTSTLTHRHQSQWWHHPQTLKGIFTPSSGEADSSVLREKNLQPPHQAHLSIVEIKFNACWASFRGYYHVIFTTDITRLVSLSDSIGLNCSNHPGKPW